MHITATVIKVSDLFESAEENGIANYNVIQDLIYYGDEPRHSLWTRSCFTVVRDAIPDWIPQVEEMVRLYMDAHDIEVLVIVTGRDAHLDI